MNTNQENTETKNYLEMQNISKNFLSVKALDQVSIKLNSGEILGIVGENGAGKSTLIKILTGVYNNDGGNILINGKNIEISSPHQARELYKIAYVSQESALCPNLTVAENIVLGAWNNQSPFINWKSINNLVKKYIEYLDINLEDVGPCTCVSELTPANKQIIEIIKALILNSKVLLLDEPTSSMSENEKKFLFTHIKKLKKKDVAIIFVSHFLDEVIAVSDNILVLKDGRSEGIFKTTEIDKDLLIHKMLGTKNIRRGASRIYNGPNEIILEVKNIKYEKKVDDVSFKLKKGEILGITGLLGSGKTEILKIIYGINKSNGGSVFIHGKERKSRSIKYSIKNGIGFITEDRKLEGIIPFLSVAKNITLSSLKIFQNYKGFINLKKEKIFANKIVNELSVKPANAKILIANLSGGNQQKIVLGKWLLADSEILILDEPTRGIDVGAKFEIYNLLKSEAEKGKSIIFVSSELAEILEVPDRFIVLKKGKIIGEYKNGEVRDEQKLLSILTA